MWAILSGPVPSSRGDHKRAGRFLSWVADNSDLLEAATFTGYNDRPVIIVKTKTED